MDNLGVEIRGNFVSFAELRSDVQAAYRKGMGSNFMFLPETVEALLDHIAAQQSVQRMGYQTAIIPCPHCGVNVTIDSDSFIAHR